MSKLLLVIMLFLVITIVSVGIIFGLVIAQDKKEDTESSSSTEISKSTEISSQNTENKSINSDENTNSIGSDNTGENTENSNNIDINLLEAENPNSQVPYPSPEYMIGLFFKALNDNNVQEAIRIMHPESLQDESTKQAYGVQFNEVEKAELINTDQYNKENWTADTRYFKVTGNIDMSQDSKDQPIPYYGYEGNPDIRWYTMKKDGNIWKIAEMSTGP